MLTTVNGDIYQGNLSQTLELAFLRAPFAQQVKYEAVKYGAGTLPPDCGTSLVATNCLKMALPGVYLNDSGILKTGIGSILCLLDW